MDYAWLGPEVFPYDSISSTPPPHVPPPHQPRCPPENRCGVCLLYTPQPSFPTNPRLLSSPFSDYKNPFSDAESPWISATANLGTWCGEPNNGYSDDSQQYQAPWPNTLIICSDDHAHGAPLTPEAQNHTPHQEPWGSFQTTTPSYLENVAAEVEDLGPTLPLGLPFQGDSGATISPAFGPALYNFRDPTFNSYTRTNVDEYAKSLFSYSQGSDSNDLSLSFPDTSNQDPSIAYPYTRDTPTLAVASSTAMLHMPPPPTETEQGLQMGDPLLSHTSSYINQTFLEEPSFETMSNEQFPSGSHCGVDRDALRETPADALRKVRSRRPETAERKSRAGRRKPPYQRQKTRDTRKAGSCSICKERKGRCAPDGPCSICLAAAHFDEILAKRICYRDTESGKEARLKIEDFFELKDRDMVPSFCKSCGPRTRDMRLIHPPQVIDNQVYHFKAEPLIIEIEECSTIQDFAALNGINTWSTAPISAPGEITEQLTKIFVKKDIDDLRARLAPIDGKVPAHSIVCLLQKVSQNYRIRVESLPTMQELIEWGSRDIYKMSKLFPLNVESVLDAIFVRYLESKTQVPLQSLVERSLSMAILGRYLDSRRPIDQDKFEYFKAQGVNDGLFRKSRIPDQVRGDLFKLAAESIESFEEGILGEIDCLLPASREKNHNISDPLILGLCIRRLSLYYRRIMLRYRKFGEDQKTRTKNAQDMYDTMIRNYSRVFKGTLSPFDENWNTVDRKEALLGDEELIRLFEQFKLAEASHYKDLDPTVDGVYRAMFIERKNKKQRNPAMYMDKIGPTVAEVRRQACATFEKV